MSSPRRSLAFTLRALLNTLLSRPSQPRRQARRFRPMLEGLENRITPSTITSPSAGSLTITLTVANEALSNMHATNTTIVITDSATPVTSPGAITGVSITGNTVTITESDFTSGVTIKDAGVAGTNVAFADSSGNAYTIPIAVDLADSESGDITFSGASVFTNVALNATTAGGTIVSTSGSAVSLTGASGRLTLSAHNDLVLQGSVTVAAGTTTLIGTNITALDAANNFGTGALAVGVDGGIINLFDNAALALGGSVFDNFGSTTVDSQITAAGSITQTSSLSGASAGPTLDFTSQGGNINLSNGGNAMQFAVGMTVSGTATATLFNQGGHRTGQHHDGHRRPQRHKHRRRYPGRHDRHCFRRAGDFRHHDRYRQHYAL